MDKIPIKMGIQRSIRD